MIFFLILFFLPHSGFVQQIAAPDPRFARAGELNRYTTKLKGEVMAKKNVFVSFDWDNDKRYKFMLDAWDANPNFAFVFSDKTPEEINSSNISRIKAGITAKVNDARYTLVIVGKEANKLHKHSKLIGHKNWINFEVYQSKQNRNKLVGIKLDKSYESPDELIGTGASWAMSFTQEAIIKALNEA